MPTDLQEKCFFGPFEIDLRSGELTRDGTRIHLQPQPLRVLSILLEHPGELVSREDFRKRLWRDDTFVDFEHSLNTDIKKLRHCLSDDVDTPRYIETLPKRGYRFKAPVSYSRTYRHPADSIDDPQVRHTAAVCDSSSAAIKSRRQRARTLVAKTVSIILIFAIYSGFKIYKSRFPQVRVKSFKRLTADGKSKALAFSDGEHPYYLHPAGPSTRDVVLVSQHGGDDVLTSLATDGAAVPGVSPDGSHFLMCEVPSAARGHGPLWAIPIPKGAPWRIGNVECEEAIYLSKEEIAATLNGELRVFDGSGKLLRSVGTIPTPTAGGLRLSPDRRRIRIGREGLDEMDREETWEINTEGSNLHRLFPGSRTKLGAWTADGSIYMFPMFDADSGTWNLWAVPERPPSLWNLWRQPKPSRLTFAPPQGRDPSAGKNGEMFFIGYDQRGESTIYDPKKGSRKPYLNGISASSVSYSNDRKWMTYVSYPDQSLWRSRPDGSEKIRLTQPPLSVFIARWAPDDKLIAFHEISNRSKIYFVSPEGGSPMLVLGGAECAGDPSWSPSGKSLVYGGCEDSKTLKLWIYDLETGKSTAIDGSDELFSPVWSPDGHWIAAMNRNADQLLLYDVEKNKWDKLPSIAPKECCGFLMFSDDSHYLYEQGDNVWRLKLPSGRAELVMPLDNHDKTVWWALGFSLTPRGEIIRMREFGIQEIYSIVVETY